jgi:hypothetical protein
MLFLLFFTIPLLLILFSTFGYNEPKSIKLTNAKRQSHLEDFDFNIGQYKKNIK